MKKIAAIAAVAFLGAIVMPSCKKDHTCTCTVGGTTTPTKITGQSKKDAKAACDQSNAAAVLFGGSCTFD